MESSRFDIDSAKRFFFLSFFSSYMYCCNADLPELYFGAPSHGTIVEP